MESLQIIALIGVILVTYIYIVKTVLKNLSRAKGILPSLFWGLMFMLTLSFFFSSNNSGYQSNCTNNNGGNNDDIYDLEDEYNNDFFEDQNDYSDYDYDYDYDYDD